MGGPYAPKRLFGNMAALGKTVLLVRVNWSFFGVHVRGNRHGEGLIGATGYPKSFLVFTVLEVS